MSSSWHSNTMKHVTQDLLIMQQNWLNKTWFTKVNLRDLNKPQQHQRHQRQEVKVPEKNLQVITKLDDEFSTTLNVSFGKVSAGETAWPWHGRNAKSRETHEGWEPEYFTMTEASKRARETDPREWKMDKLCAAGKQKEQTPHFLQVGNRKIKTDTDNTGNRNTSVSWADVNGSWEIRNSSQQILE